MNKPLRVGMTLLAVGALAIGTYTLVHRGAGAVNTTRTAQHATAPSPATGSLRSISRDADFEVIYSSIDQLAAASNAIVRGRVVSTKYVDYNEGTWTVSTVKVLRSWRPGLSRGDTITVVEEGGVTTEASLKRASGRELASPPSARDEKTKVQVLLDGAPLPQAGDESLYFLAQGTWDIAPRPYYDVVGAFQGKFKIDAARATRHAPQGWSAAYKGLDTQVAQLETAVEKTKRNR